MMCKHSLKGGVEGLWEHRGSKNGHRSMWVYVSVRGFMGRVGEARLVTIVDVKSVVRDV